VSLDRKTSGLSGLPRSWYCAGVPSCRRVFVVARGTASAKRKQEMGISQAMGSQPAKPLMTSAAFWPPKPKLVETPTLTGISRALLGT
jgi:hypothetical protein